MFLLSYKFQGLWPSGTLPLPKFLIHQLLLVSFCKLNKEAVILLPYLYSMYSLHQIIHIHEFSVWVVSFHVAIASPENYHCFRMTSDYPNLVWLHRLYWPLGSTNNLVYLYFSSAIIYVSFLPFDFNVYFYRTGGRILAILMKKDLKPIFSGEIYELGKIWFYFKCVTSDLQETAENYLFRILKHFVHRFSCLVYQASLGSISRISGWKTSAKVQ